MAHVQEVNGVVPEHVQQQIKEMLEISKGWCLQMYKCHLLISNHNNSVRQLTVYMSGYQCSVPVSW